LASNFSAPTACPAACLNRAGWMSSVLAMRMRRELDYSL
jgi:hypothetical protein